MTKAQFEVPAKELADFLGNGVVLGKDTLPLKHKPMSDSLKEQLWPVPSPPQRPEEVGVAVPAYKRAEVEEVYTQRLTEYRVALQERERRVAEELAEVEESADAVRIRSCPHIMLAVQEVEGEARLYAYAFSRYSAGRWWMPIKAKDVEPVSVTLAYDLVSKLPAALRKVPGGVSAKVRLTLFDEPVTVQTLDENMMPIQATISAAIHDGGTPLLEALDSDLEGEAERWWDLMDDLLSSEGSPIATPALLAAETLSRLSALKLEKRPRGGDWDLEILTTPHPLVNRVKMGRRFEGLIAGVYRDLYQHELLGLEESSQSA